MLSAVRATSGLACSTSGSLGVELARAASVLLVGGRGYHKNVSSREWSPAAAEGAPARFLALASCGAPRQTEGRPQRLGAAPGQLPPPCRSAAASVPLGRLTSPAAHQPPILDSLLSIQVVDHYEKPRNVGSFDKADPNVGTGLVGAPACGDVMKLQIKVATWLPGLGFSCAAVASVFMLAMPPLVSSEDCGYS